MLPLVDNPGGNRCHAHFIVLLLHGVSERGLNTKRRHFRPTSFSFSSDIVKVW